LSVECCFLIVFFVVERRLDLDRNTAAGREVSGDDLFAEKYEFSLTIPSYANTFDEEKDVNIKKVHKNIRKRRSYYSVDHLLLVFIVIM